MNCSPPGSSVHGIFQARILEWVAIPFSRGSSQPRDQTQVSCMTGRFFTIWAARLAFKWCYNAVTHTIRLWAWSLISIKDKRLCSDAHKCCEPCREARQRWGWAGQGEEPQTSREATSLVRESDGGTGPSWVRFCWWTKDGCERSVRFLFCILFFVVGFLVLF